MAVSADGGGEIAAGGGTDRSVSIFSSEGAVVATLPGHTGWVRALAFHGGHLFSVGCQFVKVWRRTPEGWGHVGDLQVHGDILGVAVAAGGVLLAAGVAAQVYQWTLPPSSLRPSDWLGEVRRSFRQVPSQDAGRISSIACHGRLAFTSSYDGMLRRWGLQGEELIFEGSAALPLRAHCMALHDDGRVACGGSDGSLLVVDGSSLAVTSSRSHLHGGAPVSGVAWVGDDCLATVSCGSSALQLTRP